MASAAIVEMRGGTSEQITILLNGINICDPQTGHNTFDVPVDISDIVRIEILEGPAGRAYGTSSLLGAINIVTKESALRPSSEGRLDSTHFSPEVRLEGGSFGYLSAATKFSVPNSQLSINYTRSDGYNRSKAGRLNADYSGFKTFYQGGYDSNVLNLHWHAGLTTKGYGSNTFYSAKYDEQFERTTKIFTALQGETKGSWIHFLPSIYWNRSHDRFELIRGSEEKVKYNYHRTDVMGINLNSWFDWTLGRTALGAEFRNEDIISTTLGEPLQTPKHIHGTDRYYTLGLNRSNLSFHLEHNILLSRLNISAGIIAVKNTQSEMPIKVYPGIDASYQIARHWKVYASYNTSLRMPSFTELYYSVGGHKADKHLKPEELRAVECGIKYFAPRLTARVSAFHHHQRNTIDWVMDLTEDGEPKTGGEWRSVNLTKINTLGFEGEAILHASRFTLHFNYCYLHQQKGELPHLQSRYSLEYLRHKLTASLQLPLTEQLGFVVKYRFQDRMGTYTDTDGHVQAYRPYSVVDTRLTWQTDSYALYAEANNLFNAHYVDYGCVPQPGCWLVVGVRSNL